MPDQKFNIYLAGASSCVEASRRLRDRLQSSMPCHVVVPQDYISCAKEDEPENWVRVFDTCKQLLDSADCVVTNLTRFGRDTAAEIGYSYARGKPIIGFADTSGCDGDAIVRGFLLDVIWDEDALIEVLVHLYLDQKRKLGLGGGIENPVANWLPKLIKMGREAS
jgi:hypothetical protein